MKRYLPRIADNIIKDRLTSKGAILIEGPKWCGKTSTAKENSNSSISIDMPNMTKQYQKIAELSPSTLLEGKTPRLIDEWQLAPNIRNAVRYEVDNRGDFGQFILTGSSVPNEFDESMHTGIGRISRYYMRTMSLYESKDSNGEVSLRELFSKKNIYIHNDREITLEDIAFLICRGGWPVSIGLNKESALFQSIDYFNSIVNVDISRVDSIKRDREKAKRLLKSYARHVGTQTSLETIRKDLISNYVETFNQDTIYSYLNALEKIFVIEDSPAWNPNLRSKTAVRTSNTRYFSDPSIATAALGIGPKDLLNDLNTMGFLFENLCIRDLRIYADYLNGSIYHFRDKNDLECDAVIHLRDGSYGLIEIKLGGNKLINDGVDTLKKLSSKIDTKKMNKPSFMMILCAKSQFSYKREDGIYVVPITSLRP